MTSPPPAPDFFDRRPLLVLLILTLAFYWKLALSSQFTFLETPDLAYQVLPWYQFEARAMRHGAFPLWDPFQWSGQSVLGQMQPGAAFPLNWPLFLAPLKNGYINFAWVHRHFVLMHLLAAILMFAFCRQLRASRFAAVLAGAAFSFGGYLGTTPWPQMLNGALWIPLVFLFFHRMIERGWGLPAFSNAALCGAAIGLSLLSGHHQAPMFTVLALGGVFLYFLIVEAGARLRLIVLFVSVALFAFLIGAFQLLPAWQYGAHAYRWVETSNPVRMGDTVPYFAQYNYGIFPLSLLGVLFPKAHLTTDPFLGFVCLSFAFFAVAAGWKDRRVRIYSCLALGALAYAAGHYSLFHGLIYTLIPFIDKARSPGHAIFVFQFAALTLTAQGIDLFFGPQQPEWERWRSRILKALVFIGLLAWAMLFWLYLNLKFETNPGDHVILSTLVAFLLAAVLYGLHSGHLTPRAARVSLILLVLFELSITSYFFISHRDDPKRAIFLKRLTDHPGIVAFLKSQRGPFRFDAASQTDWPANLGDWEGLEETRGYLASVSADLYDFVGWDWGRATLVLNTVYVVAKQPTRPEQREVYAGPDGWKVFRNDDALPRAWMVRQVRVARDAREAADLFRSPAFDPRRETILLPGAEPPRFEPCSEDATVEITRHELRRLSARSASPCAGLVVFAEPNFPGWQARLDGRPTPLYSPFGALRGVAAPAGEHVIDFVYEPDVVYAGAVLSALGLVSCAALAWLSRSHAAAASR
ncbi:MAG TPA: hypothetical protein VEU62_02415 [Bryobacterales bacterium]|nr:hypothetical protein [Bryobacterales bacterium]